MLYCLAVLACLITACRERTFDNPLDPNGSQFVGEQLAADSDEDGIADGLDPGTALIPEGCFFMGSNTNDDNEGPARTVCVDAFHISITEITEGEFRTAMPGYLFEKSGDDLPMVDVTWYDAVEYCNRLSKAHQLDPVYTVQDSVVQTDFSSNGFRLPTEVEWEYAYGSDSSDLFFWGNDESKAEDFAWYLDNSMNRVHPVAQKKKNPFGLFDMNGNALEWVNDWYDIYTGIKDNPEGPSSGIQRVARGGAFNDDWESLRSSKRFMLRPDVSRNYLGFRVMRRAD
jgi:formylglycine-generating enzyme required for sulfatase activity